MSYPITNYRSHGHTLKIGPTNLRDLKITDFWASSRNISQLAFLACAVVAVACLCLKINPNLSIGITVVTGLVWLGIRSEANKMENMAQKFINSFKELQSDARKNRLVECLKHKYGHQ